MSMTSEHAALRVLALIQSPLIDPGGHDNAYDALVEADGQHSALSSGENALVAVAWDLFKDRHPLGLLDADNAAAVIRVLADRYAPAALECSH